MSRIDKKSPEQQNPRTYASAKDRYKNQDKHRWRKVGVWLIPLVFFVPFTIAFVVHGIWFVWAVAATTIIFFGYALFLLEWYVWKTESERAFPRTVFGCLGIAVLVIGAMWNLQNPASPSVFESPITAPSPMPSPPISTPSPSGSDKREFLDIKPEKLLAFFEKYNNAQAQKLVETYIGKWMKTSGIVRDVYSGKGYSGTFVIIRTGSPSRLSVGATFSEQRWKDRALVLKRDETITVVGRITKIDEVGFMLDNCEVVE